MTGRLIGCAAAGSLVLLGACGGGYSGAPAASSGGGNAGSTSSGFTSADQFFAARVQPRLDFCRSCHVPGGVADTDAGRLMHLSSDRSQDLANFKASWQAMGGNNPLSRILIMASGQQPHTGGAPWPQNSDAYKDVLLMLSCFEKPDQCAALLAGVGSGPVAQTWPLLGSMHGRSTWEVYCEGKDGKTPQPDSAALPVDPLTQIRPGVNAGKAVNFNVFWDDCHTASPASEQAPKSCGEYRTRRELGKFMLREGFATDNGGTITAAQFNNTWQSWGLSARPANFDEMYTLRYGANRANYDNPYPAMKPDGTLEDPNAPGVNGGSGQLPLGMRQLKDQSGKWTSTIGTEACAGCHGGQIGEASEGPGLGGMYGLGNANTDPTQTARDSASQSGGAVSVIQATGLGVGLLSGRRGQSDAVTGFELLDFTLLDWDSLTLAPNPTKYPGTHPRSWQDMPAWWNVGHRPRKFFDAGVSSDAHRIISAAGGGPQLLTPLAGAASRAYNDKYNKDLFAYLLSVASVPYPEALGGAIDTALAEEGAILFHTKDLWAQPGNKDRPRPGGGNGSCAGCHGAYSPRFVHDPTFLDSPSFEGIASHVSPIAEIGTDSNRVNQLDSDFANIWDASWWSYPEGTPGYTSPDQQTAAQDAADDNYALVLAGVRPKGVCTWRPGVIGYQAPPLYGVWATAPYFHNGSVPTVAAVLDPSQRPQMWRRKLQTIGPVTGFDQRLKTAYDFHNLGWTYDKLDCASFANDPFMSCNPIDPKMDSVGTLASDLIQGTLVMSGLVNPQYLLNPDDRLVVDTRKFAQSNSGHEFTDVLTEQERKAIIEYLKTL